MRTTRSRGIRGLRRLLLLVAAVGVLAVPSRLSRRRQPPNWCDLVAARLGCEPRSAWAAAEPSEELAPLGPVRRVTVHHSGGDRYELTARDEVARSIRAIQGDHRDRRGWADIGYHYVIDPAGRVWEGRDGRRLGAHAGPGDLNEGNVGVLLLGNFEVQEPSAAQLATLRALLEALREVCGVAATEIRGHNEVREGAGFGATECPGRHLMARLAELIEGR